MKGICANRARFASLSINEQHQLLAIMMQDHVSPETAMSYCGVGQNLDCVLGSLEEQELLPYHLSFMKAHEALLMTPKMRFDIARQYRQQYPNASLDDYQRQFGFDETGLLITEKYSHITPGSVGSGHIGC